MGIITVQRPLQKWKLLLVVKALCAINIKAEKLWIYTDCEQNDKKVYINLDFPFRLLEPMWPIFKNPGKTYLAVAEVSAAIDKYCLKLSIVIIFPFQNNVNSTQSLFLWFCPVFDVVWNQTESLNLNAGYYTCHMRMAYIHVCMCQNLPYSSQLNVVSSSLAGELRVRHPVLTRWLFNIGDENTGGNKSFMKPMQT